MRCLLLMVFACGGSRPVPDRAQHSRELFVQAWARIANLPEAQARETAPLDALLDEFAEAYAAHCGARGQPRNAPSKFPTMNEMNVVIVNSPIVQGSPSIRMSITRRG